MGEKDQQTFPELARNYGVNNPAMLSNRTGLSYRTCHELWKGTAKRNRSTKVLKALSGLSKELTTTEVIDALEETGSI